MRKVILLTLLACGTKSPPQAAPEAPLAPIAIAVPAAAPPQSAQVAVTSQGLPPAERGAPISVRSRDTNVQESKDEVSPIKLTKKWSTSIGQTTFRSTMVRRDNLIILGSHGRSLKGAGDPTDGIVILDARSGKIVRRIATPGTGDKDVAGVALAGDGIVYTSNNGYVGIANVKGSLIWSRNVGKLFRAAPALADLNGDAILDVVAGDESGTLHALDGSTGVTLWSRTTGANSYDAAGFVAAPAIVDVNGDGVLDVIAGARDGVFVAYNGKTGETLWRDENSFGIHASPVIVDVDGDGRKEVLAAWSYSQVKLLEVVSGVVLWDAQLELKQGGIEGLFATPTPMPGNPGRLVMPTSWWGKRGDKRPVMMPNSATSRRPTLRDGVYLTNHFLEGTRSSEGRVTASAVVTDLDNDGSPEAILGTEGGELLAFRASGTRFLLAQLGSPIEATAMLTDVDDNGTFELLVAAGDGTLTCFETGSRAKPIVSRFRGETFDNHADLSNIRMGWNLASPVVPTPGPTERATPAGSPTLQTPGPQSTSIHLRRTIPAGGGQRKVPLPG